MKRQRINLSLPTFKKFRETIESGNLVGFMIEKAETVGADRISIKYTLKNRPFVVTLEARRIYKK